jgi:hypothetical protein
MPDREGQAKCGVIANGLQGNAKQQVHHLLLLVTGGDEVLNSLVFGIAASSQSFCCRSPETCACASNQNNSIHDGSFPV